MTAVASHCDADPAAVFACAVSLWEACDKRAGDDPELNLSDAYSGIDQLMREVMRIGEMFETWACDHVVFEAVNDVWPYFLEDRFGGACLDLLEPGVLAGFDEDDCLRVAYQLRLPLRADGSLCLPVDVRAANPIADSAFKEFRIQTVRDDLANNSAVPFTADHDPFDEDLGAPYFRLSGVCWTGCRNPSRTAPLMRKTGREDSLRVATWTVCGGTPQPRWKRNFELRAPNFMRRLSTITVTMEAGPPGHLRVEDAGSRPSGQTVGEDAGGWMRKELPLQFIRGPQRAAWGGG